MTEKEMEVYSIMSFCGRMAVLKVMEESRSGEYASPNFMGTGLCLAGFLRQGETLDSFIHRKEVIKERAQKNNEKIPQSLIKKKVFAVPKDVLYRALAKDTYFGKASESSLRKITEGFIRILGKLEREEF